MLVVRDREAGNVIDTVNTIEEGLQLIEQFEAEDRNENIYSEDFYEIAEVEEIDFPTVEAKESEVK